MTKTGIAAEDTGTSPRIFVWDQFCLCFMQIGYNLTEISLKLSIFRRKAPLGETTAAAEDTEGHWQECE